MNEEVAKCSCGGDAIVVHWTGNFVCVCCAECGKKTSWYNNAEEAIKEWELKGEK